MSTPLPLLARVRAELVEMDRDADRLDLAERPALAELVELTRHHEAVLLVRPPGQPLSDADLLRLRAWLADAGVEVRRRARAGAEPW